MNKFKNIILSVSIAGIIISPAFAFAQSGQSAAALIEQLQKQIAALKLQLEALKSAQAGVNQAAQDIQGTLKLIRELKEGSTGDQVKLLQTVLASDPEIFPEGLVTGFFGRLTSQAVKRFQKKHGFEQVGNVGPKTLKKLNEFLEKSPLKEEEEDDDEDENNNNDDDYGKIKGKRLCMIVPPGHLIAPGWLKKHNGVKPVVPECQKLPPGIEKKLTGTSTPPTTPPTPSQDTTAPVISSVTAIDITANSAKIKWITNESASSWVWYSTSTPVSTASPTLSAGTSTLVADHNVLLGSLTASTTYYYRVSSSDTAGNSATSVESNFLTQ